MGLEVLPPPLSNQDMTLTVSDLGDAVIRVGEKTRPQLFPRPGLKCVLIITPTALALMLDAWQRGRLCNSLFSRLVASSQGLSVSCFSGTGPDQYCILSDLSKPSGEGNHYSGPPCTFLSRSILWQRRALFPPQLCNVLRALHDCVKAASPSPDDNTAPALIFP